MTTPYTQTIRETVARLGYLGVDPRHVEAYMRLDHPTLDGLSRSQFVSEVKIAVQCVDAAGVVSAERCAQSYGL
jgi:hypothetical protein